MNRDTRRLSEQEKANLTSTLALFDAWRQGQTGYDSFISDDCLYETAGFPVLRGRKEISEFLFGGGLAEVAKRYGNPALDTIRRLDAEVLHIAAVGDMVYSERVDHHFDAGGHEVLSPRLVGVMKFTPNGRCSEWRDYHDPAYFTGRPVQPWGDGRPVALAPGEPDATGAGGRSQTAVRPPQSDR